jgi:hypothetical protein
MRLIVLVSLLIAAAGCGPQRSTTAARPYDLVIRNGDVIDGTGAPARHADVAITGDRIVAIGTVTAGASRTIDATGRVVAPGFIDVQGQSGTSLLTDGNGESHIRQGITTEISSRCSRRVEASTGAASMATSTRCRAAAPPSISARSPRLPSSGSRYSQWRAARRHEMNCNASRTSWSVRCSRARSASRRR